MTLDSSSCDGVCACRQTRGAGDDPVLIVASATGHAVAEVARLARASGRPASLTAGDVRIIGADLAQGWLLGRPERKAARPPREQAGGRASTSCLV